MIKCIIKEISKPLCHIFNLSLSTGIFPDKLKIARVTPVFKSGDKCELSNYRPISVLPCFSKILEKIVYNRTVKFLDRNNILGSYQYGFRSKYSTSMALTDIANKIVPSHWVRARTPSHWVPARTPSHCASRQTGTTRISRLCRDVCPTAHSGDSCSSGPLAVDNRAFSDPPASARCACVHPLWG